MALCPISSCASAVFLCSLNMQTRTRRCPQRPGCTTCAGWNSTLQCSMQKRPAPVFVKQNLVLTCMQDCQGPPTNMFPLLKNSEAEVEIGMRRTMCGTISGPSGCPGASRWPPSLRLAAVVPCATRSPTTTSFWCVALPSPFGFEPPVWLSLVWDTTLECSTLRLRGIHPRCAFLGRVLRCCMVDTSGTLLAG